jgi:hypothetical protein
MGIFDWLFNFGNSWEEISDPPKWLEKKVIQYWDSYPKRHGCSPYNQTKHFYGKTFVYKVYYKTVAQGQFIPVYYQKLRKHKL